MHTRKYILDCDLSEIQCPLGIMKATVSQSEDKGETNWSYLKLCREPPLPRFSHFPVLAHPQLKHARHSDILRLLCERCSPPLVILSTVSWQLLFDRFLFFWSCCILAIKIQCNCPTRIPAWYHIVILFNAQVIYCLPFFPIFFSISFHFLKCLQVLLMAFPAEPWQLLAIR